jgi:hypothetical protein
VSSRFARKADRDNNMATEGRRYVGRKNLELLSTAERGKELVDMRERMEELELWMQKAKPRWVYEWLMMKTKAKWLFK